MKITLEFAEGRIREVVDEINESRGLRRSDYGFLTAAKLKSLIRDPANWNGFADQLLGQIAEGIENNGR